MSEQHDILWSICRKLPSDFQPYGRRDRDASTPCGDCSCGCVHFVLLQGALGSDWGVCANPKSPRAGLLTFEHQGCPQFEALGAAPVAHAEPMGERKETNAQEQKANEGSTADRLACSRIQSS